MRNRYTIGKNNQCDDGVTIAFFQRVRYFEIGNRRWGKLATRALIGIIRPVRKSQDRGSGSKVR
jgi:hypothetical protein